MGVWYVTRQAVKAALDVAETARANRQIDRIIGAATAAVEGELDDQRFYPYSETRYFPWPQSDQASWKLELGPGERLNSVTALVAGGTTIASGDYFLEPDTGPPFATVEIDLSSNASFESGDTFQRSIAITGVWSDCELNLLDRADLAEALDTTETEVDVTDSSGVGVGSIAQVDSERMLITGQRSLDTGQNIGGNLTASKADVTVAVSNGTLYFADETITVDSERMLIEDITGNNLTVRRAYDGSTLAAHTTGADIYAPRRLVVTRGALGTTAAAHDSGATVNVVEIPDLIAQFTLAHVLVMLGQTQSGYARTVGSGESEREASGRGLMQLRKLCRARYCRQNEPWTRAV